MNLGTLKALMRNRLRPDYDLHSLAQLVQFNLGYLPWTTSAMRPAGLRLAVNEVLVHERQSGIEFGAGISTLFLAKAFSRSKGQLTVVEHDIVWLEKIRSELSRIGVLENTCTLVYAPLIRCAATNGNGAWYQQDALEKSIGSATYDFSLVDGPISRSENDAVRNPACAFLKNRLRSSYAIFVDDIDRPKDLEMAHSWTQDLGGRINVYEFHGAVAVIRAAQDNPYNIC
jgi:hypothetical protein